MNFIELSNIIQSIHFAFSRQAGRSVNVALTTRNWLIGLYIKEYEQKGYDRAEYGSNLLKKLSDKLQTAKVPSTAYSSLKQYRQFYDEYSIISQTVSSQLKNLEEFNLLPKSISQTVSSQFIIGNIEEIKETDIPRLDNKILLNNLSYSHFTELIKITDSLKRSFYEIESIRGSWSARELRRQISTLYYERLSMSKNKKKIAQMVQTGTYAHDIKDIIREPYMFEFVGIQKSDVTETNLTDAILKQLNKFFLEMGRGFCFEASNKKILIGDQFFFIDLVLYHKVLKCNILIELKINELNHEHIGQLNTYINYYKKNEMVPGDNPPVGLLLCTEKNETLVEYALGGLDNQLFISKYKLELPSQSEIQSFLQLQLKEVLMIDK